MASKKRKTYSREFKMQAVGLITEKGYSIAEASRNLGIDYSVLRRWRKELTASPDSAFHGKGNLRPDDEELRRVRRDLERVTELEGLRKDGVLEDFEIETAMSIFEWFNSTMPCPPWQESNWPSDAISWFKDSAQEYISKMYDIVAILDEHGIPVRILKTERLASILYEDDYQVVAI